jgi:uncharacterized protein
MSLIEQIKKNQVEARKARKTVAATLLTTLLGEANMVAKNAQRALPTDAEVTAVVKKFLDRNAELQASVHKALETQESHNHAYISSDILNRLTVAKEEQAILEGYMPKQIPEDELLALVQGAILGGVEKSMGALMAFLKSNYVGQYDGKVASSVVKAAIAA